MINPAPRQDLERFTNPGPNREAIFYSYYSRKWIAPTATEIPSDMSFFQDVVGVASTATSPNAAINRRDTNMQKAGAIANPNIFLAQFLNIAVYDDVIADSLLVGPSEALQQFLANCFVTITVQDKEYQTIPLSFVPAGGGLVGSSGYSGPAITFATNGRATKANALPLELPLENEASFSVRVRHAEATSFTVAQAMYIECVLSGILVRAKQ